MAEVKVAIIKHLMNTPAVFAAFGNRIKSEFIKEDNIAYPYAVLWVVTSPNQYGHQGQSGRKPFVQIDVFDDDETGADANALLIENALSGYRGAMGSLTAGHVFVNRGPDMWNPTERNYRRIIEVTIGTND